MSGSAATPEANRAIMQQNAAEQAGALNQDPGGADRDQLLKDRLKEPIHAGVSAVRNAHPDAQWFGEKPIGLFIHWGIASVDGDADLSWPMIMNMGTGRKIKPRDYWRLAERFKAEKYDPHTWLRAARAAGFTYAVMVTRHHDGYTLFPTTSTDLGVQTYLPGRDLVREYVDACRASNMKVGLYYSGPDWWHDREYHDFNYRAETGGPTGSNSSLPAIPGRRSLDIDFKEAVLPPVPASIVQKARDAANQQLNELLTRYGQIDVLWFDGGCGCDITVEAIRRLQPGIVINNRGVLRSEVTGSIWPGDYFTFEHGEPLETPPGWWEQLAIWNEPAWGYTKPNETHYAPTDQILAKLSRARSRGGAMLINCGPRADGTMPAPYYAGMVEFAAGLKRMNASG
jgi:alpha-L-fucosidase